MEQNGGAVNWPRGQYLAEKPVESCAVCHGTGKMADIKVVHALVPQSVPAARPKRLFWPRETLLCSLPSTKPDGSIRTFADSHD